LWYPIRLEVFYWYLYGMKVLITEKQLKRLSKKIPKEVKEQEADAPVDPTNVDPTPTTGVSDKQKGGEGYPEVSTWSDLVGSKLTRGPANQIANTKWSDTVGATLTRGPANQLK